MYCVKDSFYLFSETVNIFSKDILMNALLHPSFFFYTKVICMISNLYFDCSILAERNGNLSRHEMVTDMTLMRILKERPRLPENQIHRFDHARELTSMIVFE